MRSADNTTPEGVTESDSQPPAKRRFMDRASARTPDEREQHYLAWLDQAGQEDTEERRELFWRRYSRPRPPAGLSVPNITKESTAA